MKNNHPQRELIQTSIFVAVAVVALGCAFIFRPAPDRMPLEGVGDKVFPDFTDPNEIGSLEVVRIEDKEIKRLKIANEAGVWSLASHKNYPADAEDAKERIDEAALNLMDIEVLAIATELTAEHKMFGVEDPTDEDAEMSSGAGLLIVVEDTDGGKLAELIIGEKVKGSPEQRFVRRPSQDRVYVAKIDPEKLSTKFDDWIEGNLLGVNQSDVKRLVFKDFNFEMKVQRIELPNGQVAVIPDVDYEPRTEIKVDWDSEEFEWKLGEYIEFRNQRPVAAKLSDDEEINKDKLNDLKTALDDVKIVDAHAKPKGIRPDLQVDEALRNDPEATESLVQRGFYPVQVREGVYGLLSSDGEVRIGTDDYVELILRFGKSAGIEEQDGKAMLNRYLLVSAAVDEERIPLPELESVPPEKAPEPDPKSDDKKDDAKAGKKDGDAKDDAASNETNDKADKTTDKTDESSNDTSADDKADAAADEYKQKRDEIIKENEREQEKYDETLEKAKEKADELNGRFADWYYVISEDVYKKMNLSRIDLIKEKDSAAEEGFGPDAFRKLEEDGLTKEEKDALDDGKDGDNS